MNEIEKAQRILEGRCLNCEGTTDNHEPGCVKHPYYSIGLRAQRFKQYALNEQRKAQDLVNRATQEQLTFLDTYIQNKRKPDV